MTNGTVLVASPSAIGRQPEASGSSVPAWPTRLAANSRLTTLTAWVEVSVVKRLFAAKRVRSEEHTSELQSHLNLVCRLLLEKKKGANSDRLLSLTPFACPVEDVRVAPATVFEWLTGFSCHVARYASVKFLCAQCGSYTILSC